MKIAISSTGKDLNSSIDVRFGRCTYFIIADPDTMVYEVFENESSTLKGSAGIQSAQFVASKGVEIVITGNCGPKATRILEAAGIKVITGCSGTIKQALEDFKNGKLGTSLKLTVSEHFGMRNTNTEMEQRRDDQQIQIQKKDFLRIAVPINENILSQHFGHTKMFLIADVEGGKIIHTETRIPPPHKPGVLPQWINELGVNVVITGGMGRRAMSLFDEKGIKVVVGAPQIDPIEAIKEYLKGTLETGENVCSH